MQYNFLKVKVEKGKSEAEVLGLKTKFTSTAQVTKSETPPFVEALGSALEEADPLIKAHFTQPCGIYRYRGVLKKVWRRSGWKGRIVKPFLKMTSRMDILFAYTGEEIPFELINRVSYLPNGRLSMTWERLFYFPQGRQRFIAIMVYDPQRQFIIDYLGNQGQLEVELHAQISKNAMSIIAGRQWWRVGYWRLPFPKLLAGQALVREWQEGEEFCISVTIQNPLLGQFFGYEGRFELVESIY